MIDLLGALLDPLEVALLVTVFLITVTPSVRQVIRTYRIQAGLLAAATGLTAFIKLLETGDGVSQTFILIILIVILPGLLAMFIKPILVRATLGTPSFRFWWTTADERQEAVRIWRKNEQLSGASIQHAIFFIGLVGLAFLVAFRIITGDTFRALDRIGMMVSLALHLGGLYNMIVKQDIISQVIGLLVMDHGLYLAVVKIVAIPVPAVFFVISLYFYTLITIVILVFLLPQIKQWFDSIDLDGIAEHSNLKG